MTTQRRKPEVNDISMRVGKVEATLDSVRSEVHAVTRAVEALNKALAERAATDWRSIFAGVSILLVISGMAAALVSSTISSEANQRTSSDNAISALVSTRFDSQNRAFEMFIENEYEPVESRNIQLVRDVAVLQERSREMEGIIESITEIKTQLAAHNEQLMAGDDDHQTLVTRFDRFDEILQREMRLLDEILQRELGLNIDRLEDLIEVNTGSLQRILDTRFTNADAALLQDALKELRERTSILETPGIDE